ncbi:unnamed protein product [Mytilus coruscus]|uniref:Uncharacterized protein n=1 Tax=Mytilus coruscus TaxID=42192 RepID=A0A6J8CIR1_MYTCO|nr:unnamed protein product [Mytilus coruscus]
MLRDGRSIYSTNRFVQEIFVLYQASWDDLRQCIAKNHVDLTHLSAVLVKLEKKTHFDKKRQNEVEDIETSVTEIVQTILDKMDGMIVTRSTGTMKIMPDLVKILTNTLDDSFLPFYTLWTPKRDTEAVGISIDVTPSFRLDSDYLNFNRTFVNVDALKQISEIIGKDKCFMRLVLRDDDHWRLSLSHVETDVIREADDIHKMCILKMLKEGKPLDTDQDHMPNASYMESSARSFKFTEMCTSYAIKTAILRHIISCIRSTCGLGSCFISILLGREQDATSAAEQVCQERKKYMHDICTSDDFKDIQDWYIGAI